MHIKNITKLVIVRVAAVWLGLSILIGVFVYQYEYQKMKELVLSLALKEAATFDAATIDKITSSDIETIDRLQSKVDHLINTHFVMVDIYDDKQSHIVAAIRYDDTEMQAHLEARHHKFPLDKTQHFEHFYVDEQLFLQVLLPLHTSTNHLVGYFEGIYLVDSETLATIKQEIFNTLTILVVTILVTALVLVPIIMMQNRRLIKTSRDLLTANIELLEVLGSAIATRDYVTNSHNYRVTLYATRLAEALKLPHRKIKDLIVGAFLHDVGKIGISDTILQKAGSLTTDEKVLMNQHVTLGIKIAEKSSWLGGAKDVIQYHHESYDGSGYVANLKGENIPITARIFAVVDVFDALTSERPYKSAFSVEDAVAILKEQSDKQLDSRLVDKFISIAPSLHAGICCATEDQLKDGLNRAIEKYFFRS